MRWLDPEVTTPAALEPVTEAEALAHCRVDADDADNAAIIPGLISAARAYLEAYSGLQLAEQGVTLRAWGFDQPTFLLPVAPVSDLSGITYLDAAGAEQTLAPSVYLTALHGLSPIVSLGYNQFWPAHRCQLGAVTIAVTCGYAEGACPEPIKQAILLIVGDWFANREQAAQGVVSAIPMVAVEALLTNFRRSYV